jgi:hypothetical protein
VRPTIPKIWCFIHVVSCHLDTALQGLLCAIFCVIIESFAPCHVQNSHHAYISVISTASEGNFCQKPFVPLQLPAINAAARLEKYPCIGVLTATMEMQVAKCREGVACVLGVGVGRMPPARRTIVMGQHQKYCRQKHERLCVCTSRSGHP